MFLSTNVITFEGIDGIQKIGQVQGFTAIKVSDTQKWANEEIGKNLIFLRNGNILEHSDFINIGETIYYISPDACHRAEAKKLTLTEVHLFFKNAGFDIESIKPHFLSLDNLFEQFNKFSETAKDAKNQAKIKQLQDMGYTVEQATMALQNNYNDVEFAANYLIEKTNPSIPNYLIEKTNPSVPVTHIAPKPMLQDDTNISEATKLMNKLLVVFKEKYPEAIRELNEDIDNKVNIAKLKLKYAGVKIPFMAKKEKQRNFMDMGMGHMDMGHMGMGHMGMGHMGMGMGHMGMGMGHMGMNDMGMSHKMGGHRGNEDMMEHFQNQRSKGHQFDESDSSDSDEEFKHQKHMNRKVIDLTNSGAKALQKPKVEGFTIPQVGSDPLDSINKLDKFEMPVLEKMRSEISPSILPDIKKNMMAAKIREKELEVKEKNKKEMEEQASSDIKKYPELNKLVEMGYDQTEVMNAYNDNAKQFGPTAEDLYLKFHDTPGFKFTLSPDDTLNISRLVLEYKIPKEDAKELYLECGCNSNEIYKKIVQQIQQESAD